MGVFTDPRVMMIGGVAAIGMWMQVDLAMNYQAVDARITGVKFDCFIKNSDSKLVEKDSNKQAYLDCKKARSVAKEFGYAETDIKQRAKLTFTWTSPVDGSTHSGEHNDEIPAKDYKVGDTISIYAHNEDPEQMRWM
jgi:hypothetical protein